MAFCVGGLIVTLPYALLNWRLFGGPLSTGYGTSPLSGFTHPFLRGLYGLTFSTGRGIFWFSPPLFLALFAARRFFRQHPAEAIGCLVIVVTHYAFYCGHFEWAGGGAWGPRYLMIALPFAYLPIVAFLADLRGRRIAQVAATVIIAAGFWCNSCRCWHQLRLQQDRGGAPELCPRRLAASSGWRAPSATA